MLLQRTGVRRFFVVTGYEQVATFILQYRRIQESEPNLYTGDFSTMYTTIPHADLLMRLRECYEEAWDFEASDMGIGRNQLFLKVTYAGVKTCDAEWVEVRRRPRNPYGDSKWIFTMDSLTELVRFLVENT